MNPNQQSICMKTAIFFLTALSVSSSLLHADFSERKLQNAMASATKNGKLLAFVFYQDYALPNCPKCVTSTDANNQAVKKAIPSSDVVVVKIEKDDKDLDKLPACVGKAGSGARLVITDAQGKAVVAKTTGSPDRDQAKEIKALVEKARGGA